MGLNHDFYLVTYDEYKEVGYDDYSYFIQDFSNTVQIHDDIIQYVQDTFEWIPSINPAMDYEKQFGLCNYGITLFDKEGAKVIYELANAWVDLFSNGPKLLKLTGNYCWSTNKQGITEGEYELLQVDRDELCEKLKKLQFFSEKVISGDYLILHHGI